MTCLGPQCELGLHGGGRGGGVSSATHSHGAVSAPQGQNPGAPCPHPLPARPGFSSLFQSQ